MDKEKDDIINPEFSTSVFYDMKPMSADELIKILDKEIFAMRDLRRMGYIHSNKYSFINPANFPDSNSNLLRIMEKYYNENYAEEIANGILRKIELETFYNKKNENQQIIYDSNRFTQHQALLKFEKIFNVNCF